MAQSSCFLSPFFVPFTYLETLLAVTGSVHLGLRLLINWPPLSQPFPLPPHSKFPVPSLNMRLTMTTLRIRLLSSGTLWRRCVLLYTNWWRELFTAIHKLMEGLCTLYTNWWRELCTAIHQLMEGTVYCYSPTYGGAVYWYTPIDGGNCVLL